MKRTSIIWQLPSSEFIALVQTSTSHSQILDFFHISNKTGNFRTLKTRIGEEGVSIEHFKYYMQLVRFKPKRTPNELIFVKDSTVDRKTARKFLLREKLIPYNCALCNLSEVWNNKPITLQLDHINGVSNDHRVDNLRWLCPNCHSQTDTYGGRKVKIFKVCSGCGGPRKSKKSKHCSECASKYRRILNFSKRKLQISSLDDFNLLINSGVPLTTIGKYYGVTANAIKKECSKRNIAIKGYKTVAGLTVQDVLK